MDDGTVTFLHCADLALDGSTVFTCVERVDAHPWYDQVLVGLDDVGARVAAQHAHMHPQSQEVVDVGLQDGSDVLRGLTLGEMMDLSVRHGQGDADQEGDPLDEHNVELHLLSD
jgi:hypothetical protein